jgi:hypothetical protein
VLLLRRLRVLRLVLVLLLLLLLLRPGSESSACSRARV